MAEAKTAWRRSLSAVTSADMVASLPDGVPERVARLEFEPRSLEKFASRAQARAAVAGWIEDYNTVRCHSALGMRSPVAYEQSLRGKDSP